MFARKVLTACFFTLACYLPIHAQVYTGTLNYVPASSSLNFSGTLLGTPFVAQPGSPSSLTTTYSGTVSVTVNFDNNTIVFSSASAVAANSGSWSPVWDGTNIVLGTAPANYGVNHTATSTTAAVRTSGITISSTPLALTGGPGSYNFGSTETLAYLPGGFLDFSSGLLGTGHNPLTGSGANTSGTNGTLVDLGGGSFQLTTPILSISPITQTGVGVIGSTQLSGNLFATGTLVAVPEPTTYALIGLSLGAAGFFGYRHKRNLKKLQDAKVV